MPPVLVSAASRPARTAHAVRRPPLLAHRNGGDQPPASVARILPPDGTTPIVAAFQSSV